MIAGEEIIDMLRRVMAALAGVVAAIGVNVVGQMIAHALFPIAMPSTMDQAALAAAMAAAPLAAKLSLILIYTTATLVGAAVATLVDGRRAGWPAYVVLGLFLLATTANFFMLPHPLWLVISCYLGELAGALLGIRLARR